MSKSYYLEPRKKNIYALWESSLSDGDSTTPSVSSLQYRAKIVAKIVNLLSEKIDPSVLSIGCGNAFVEADLVRAGASVIAFDIHDEAIQYARAKGVDARHQDLVTWIPEIDTYDVAYCDGIVGHLYDKSSGLQMILGKIYDTLTDDGHVLISNDPSNDASRVQAHPSVPGFMWFSSDFIVDQLGAAGFEQIHSEGIEYMRPESGVRNRLVVSAKKPARVCVK